MKIEKALAVNLVKSSNDTQKSQSFGRLPSRKSIGLTEEAFMSEALKMEMPVDMMRIGLNKKPKGREKFLKAYKELCKELRKLFQKDFIIG